MLNVVEAPTATGVFDRIVCGIDETGASLEAARQAARLRSSDGLLRLAAVADVDRAVHAGFRMSHVLEELDAAAREGLHRAIEAVRPDSTHLLAGDPVSCLLDEVARSSATLVAVGPHGHSRAAGLLLGAVSTGLLHDAPCSVLLARRRLFGPFPSRILVGTDGSPASLEAAKVARSLAERFRAELLVVAATGGKPIEVEAIEELTPGFVSDPRRPVEVLVDVSARADLVVVGSRGLHGLRALGSVSERIAHRACCSVLVVRPPSD